MPASTVIGNGLCLGKDRKAESVLTKMGGTAEVTFRPKVGRKVFILPV